jgi:hypothetical protein
MMPEELKQRVKDEGGAVAAFIMNERLPRPKGGWGDMTYLPLCQATLAALAAAYVKREAPRCSSAGSCQQSVGQ